MAKVIKKRQWKNYFSTVFSYLWIILNYLVLLLFSRIFLKSFVVEPFLSRLYLHSRPLEKYLSLKPNYNHNPQYHLMR